MVQQQSKVGVAIVIALLGCVATALAGKPSTNNFYSGKQIRLIVSTGPGGAYDAWARLIAQYLPAHIPGNPAIIVQNMEGASGIKATNYIYNETVRDGTVFAATHSSIPTAPILNRGGREVRREQIVVDRQHHERSLCRICLEHSADPNFEDAKTKEIILGGAAPGAPNVAYPIISNALFGTKFKVIPGYPSMGDVNLAMQRGEVQGDIGVSWRSGVKNTIFDWVRDRQVRVVVQFGFTKDPELPDVPLFVDQAKTAEDREMLDVLLASQELSKPYFAPPEVPAERLEMLRQAFDATLKDQNFIEAAGKGFLDVDGSMTGPELAALVGKLSRAPLRSASVWKRYSRPTGTENRTTRRYCRVVTAAS